MGCSSPGMGLTELLGFPEIIQASHFLLELPPQPLTLQLLLCLLLACFSTLIPGGYQYYNSCCQIFSKRPQPRKNWSVIKKKKKTKEKSNNKTNNHQGPASKVKVQKLIPDDNVAMAGNRKLRNRSQHWAGGRNMNCWAKVPRHAWPPLAASREAPLFLVVCKIGCPCSQMAYCVHAYKPEACFRAIIDPGCALLWHCSWCILQIPQESGVCEYIHHIGFLESMEGFYEPFSVFSVWKLLQKVPDMQ